MIQFDPNLTLPRVTGRQATGTLEFVIPKSPLRTATTERSPARDPVKDSVELTRDFPGLVIPESYAAASTQIPGAAPRDGTERGKSTEGTAKDRTSSEEDDGDGAFVTADAEEGESGNAPADESTDARGEPLEEAEQRELAELKNRDREVRTHEQAHKAAGGSHAGAISYDYQQGPDGKRYAVGGEVSIDVSKENEPAATITKMRQVRAAALAPAEPSSQDRSVAAQAMQTENEARQELAQERAEGTENGGEQTDGNGSGEGDDTNAGSSNASTPETGNASRSGGTSVTPSGNGSTSGGYARLASPYESSGAPFSAPMFRMASSFVGYTPLDVIA